MTALHCLVDGVLAAQPDVTTLHVEASACACKSASQHRVAVGSA